jgi:hypothetical protein
MHPHALNEIQCNIIEISYMPEMKSLCHMYAALQEQFNLIEFISRIPN